MIFKGDANNAPDSRQLAQREIIGRVLFSIPYVGYGVETARTPYGFLALIIVPALIVIVDEVRKIWGELKKRRGIKLSVEGTGEVKSGP